MFGWLSPYVGNFDGKAIFITGCDTGFGRLMALEYCKEGAHVFAACLTKGAVDALSAEASGKGRISTVLLDVTDADQVQAAYEYVRSELEKEKKQLYALINNAGVIGGWYAEMTTMAEYKRVMNINFYGPVQVAKAFLPLIQQPGGRVIGIVSAAGVYVTKGTSAYACSKFAHNAFVDALRNELYDSGIKVIKVMPGGHKTEGAVQFNDIVAAEKRYNQASDDVKGHYPETLVEDFLALGAKYSKYFGDPSNVVKAVRKALLLKKPAVGYYVGNDSWFMGKILSIIPASYADCVQRSL